MRSFIWWLMPASLTIRWETLDRLLADGLEDLAVAHWEEVELDQAEVPLALDFERTRLFERIGQHKTAGVRAGTQLVGYAAWTILSATFHKTTIHGFCTAFYVEPKFRGFGSLSVLPWCERELDTLGVKKIYVAARTPRQCDLFKKLGYVETETMFSKLLGDGHERRHRASSVPAA